MTIAKLATSIAGIVPLGLLAVASSAADLSRYRAFPFGSSVPEIAKQTGLDLSRVTVRHRRPALLQELEWLPQSQSSPVRNEPVKSVHFRFYQGKLFQMVVDYDHYETEGLTADDIVEALSTNYGAAVLSPTPLSSDRYFPDGEAIAHWEDEQFRFDLLRLSYGPSYRLVGIVKQAAVLARAAAAEAVRLDEKEAPQREVERQASEDDLRRIKAEKARTANKPKFRP